MTIENELYRVVDKAKKYDQLLEFQNSLSEVHCSFCGKSQTNVRKIIAGRNVYICDGCVDTCNEILKDKTD